MRDEGGYTTDEYRVYWIENGRFDEGKSSYHDDQEDAVGTLIAVLDRHPETQLTDARYTLDLIAKYRPDFMLAEVRRIMHESGLKNVRGYGKEV